MKEQKVLGKADWDARFLALANLVASCSKDPSMKVGCVLVGPRREVLSVGYNGFPRGVADDERLSDREAKYLLVVHAEANALLTAGRSGTRVEGSVAYVTFAPCSRCASMMIQAGVGEVVYAPCVVPERWKSDLEVSAAMMREAGVAQRIHPGVYLGARYAPEFAPSTEAIEPCPKCHGLPTGRAQECTTCGGLGFVKPEGAAVSRLLVGP